MRLLFLLTLLGAAVTIVLNSTNVVFLAGGSSSSRREELPGLTDDMDEVVPEPAAPLRVAILESMGYHDEVTAALAYAFSQHPATAANLTLYLKAQRFGIGRVYGAWFLGGGPLAARHIDDVILPAARIQDLVQLPEEANGTTAVDVLVLTTCERDYIYHRDVLMRLFSFTRTHLFCVVHQADGMTVIRSARAEPGTMVAFYAPWIERRRITFLTLSPHVSARLLTRVVPTWRNDTSVAPRVETFAPVFPVAPPDENAINIDDGDRDTNASISTLASLVRPNETAFTIQGDFEPARRSYRAVLSQLQELVRAKGANQTDLTLHLLGSGSGFEIPMDLTSHVVIDSELDYVPYYDLIGRSVAIVPAFAAEEYYYERASSSVPASLIGGCPLVASRRLLSAYSYLDESVVWVQEEGETEIDVVLRVATERSEDERRAIKERVRRRTRKLCGKNVRDLVRWASEAKAAADTADTAAK